MSEYFSSIITASAILGMLEALAPRGRGLDKYIKMIGLIIILCITVSPISQLLGQLGDGGLLDDLRDEISGEGELDGEYRDRLNEYLNDYSSEMLKNELYAILSDKFSIPREECEISLKTEYSEGQYHVARVQILLFGGSIFKNPYNIEEYIADLLSCECEVLIKSG